MALKLRLIFIIFLVVRPTLFKAEMAVRDPDVIKNTYATFFSAT